MAGIVTDAGERYLLTLAMANLDLLAVRLIKTPFVQRAGQQVTDWTEANFLGYAAEPLLFAGLLAGNPGGRAIATFTQALFTCSAAVPANLIYGYWVSHPDGRIILAERFAGLPRPMNFPGNTVAVDVTLRLWCPV